MLITSQADQENKAAFVLHTNKIDTTAIKNQHMFYKFLVDPVLILLITNQALSSKGLLGCHQYPDSHFQEKLSTADASTEIFIHVSNLDLRSGARYRFKLAIVCC